MSFFVGDGGFVGEPLEISGLDVKKLDQVGAKIGYAITTLIKELNAQKDQGNVPEKDRMRVIAIQNFHKKLEDISIQDDTLLHDDHTDVHNNVPNLPQSSFETFIAHIQHRVLGQKEVVGLLTPMEQMELFKNCLIQHMQKNGEILGYPLWNFTVFVYKFKGTEKEKEKAASALKEVINKRQTYAAKDFKARWADWVDAEDEERILDNMKTILSFEGKTIEYTSNELQLYYVCDNVVDFFQELDQFAFLHKSTYPPETVLTLEMCLYYFFVHFENILEVRYYEKYPDKYFIESKN